MNDPLTLDGAQALYAKALELSGDDESIATRLLEMIADTNRATLALLRSDMASSSWDAVASASHRIAGSARLLCSDELIGWLGKLEAAARARDAVAAGAVLPRVIDAVAQLDTAIATALRDVVRL